MSKTILLKGATGSTGGQTINELLRADEKVRALVHREEHRSAALARQVSQNCRRGSSRPEQCAEKAVQGEYSLNHVDVAAKPFAAGTVSQVRTYVPRRSPETAEELLWKHKALFVS